MAHSDDATKTWVSAIPTANADGKVRKWDVKYKYTLNSFSHTFNKSEKIETPSKAPGAYTQAELLTLMNKDHWDKVKKLLNDPEYRFLRTHESNI